MVELSVEERVDNGIKRLDERGPRDWRSRIDVDDVDVASIFACPLTQIFGGFGYGCDALGIGADPSGRGAKFGFERDYSLIGWDASNDYDALTTEWIRRLSS